MLLADLCCPRCRAELDEDGTGLSCRGCGTGYPVLDGRPVLLTEHSLFDADQLERGTSPGAFDEASAGSRRWRRLARHLPRVTGNYVTEGLVQRIATDLLAATERPRVLVLGGGVVGRGMAAILDDPRFDVVESDIFLGPRNRLVLDAHDIPFRDDSFDAVIGQAVLEHVADPYRCVAEMDRVLRPDGLVYASTSFIQQVHGGAYDFTRFTPVGHRRLFRRFAEIEAGVAVGPGSALAWTWCYFLAAFASNRPQRVLAHVIGRLTSFPLARLDRVLARRRGAGDAASAVYFVGRALPGDQVLSDREIVATYTGLH